MEYRIEHDSMGEVRVPADKFWGAQTQRSVENFPIGVGLETMPKEIIRAFGYLKKAAAMANHVLKPEKMTRSFPPFRRPARRSSPGTATTSSHWLSGRPAPAPSPI